MLTSMPFLYLAFPPRSCLVRLSSTLSTLITSMMQESQCPCSYRVAWVQHHRTGFAPREEDTFGSSPKGICPTIHGTTDQITCCLQTESWAVTKSYLSIGSSAAESCYLTWRKVNAMPRLLSTSQPDSMQQVMVCLLPSHPLVQLNPNLSKYNPPTLCQWKQELLLLP